MEEIPVIRTKLIPPRVGRPYLRRPRLLARLAAGSTVPIVLVEAGAGYGKSTLLGSFIRECNEPAAWYTLSEGDSDPLVFCSHLIGAIASVLPAITSHLIPLVERAGRNELPWRLVCDTLNNFLFDALEEDTWLVLDDLHLLAEAHVTCRLLNRFLSHAPPLLHTVLATRYRPDLPILAQTLAKGQAIELAETDLRLTPDEIKLLFRRHHSIPLIPEQADHLYEETEGWVIALQLLAHQLRGLNTTAIDEALTDLPRQLDTLFEFLTRTIIARQPDDVQRFLHRTAILRQLEPVACRAVCPAANSCELLAQLRETGLGLIQVDERTYRHHHLVHEFLSRHLKRDQGLWCKLHRRAATYFVDAGRPEESIYHLLEGGDYEAAAHHIRAVAGTLVQTGRFPTVTGWFDRLPARVVREWPELSIIRGDVARLTSRYDEALRAYRDAEALYAEQQDHAGECRALKGQGLVYIDTVRPAQAETLLKQALRTLRRQDQEESGRLLRLLAENAANRGRPSLASRWYGAARRLGAQADLELEARIQLRSGRLTDAQALLESSTGSNLDHRPARTHREPSLLVSFIQTLLGEAQAARRGAERGLRLARRLQSPFTEAVAHMRLGHAWQLPPHADIDRARDHYEQALQLVGGLDVPRGEAEPLFGLTLLNAFNGSPRAAEEAAARGLRIAQAAGDSWIAALLHLSLGICRSLHTAFEQAHITLKEAAHQFEQCDDIHGTTAAYLWLTWLTHRYKDTDLFATYADKWLHLAEQYEQHLSLPTLFTFRDPQQSIRLLIAARDAGVRSEIAGRLLVQRGLEADLPYHPGYGLRVKTLGGFEVRRGGQIVDQGDWQRSKARDLFKMFVIHHDQMRHRDQYIEWLCPDVDPLTGENHFKVALNALQRALEPDRPRHAPSFFVKRHGTQYGLNPAAAIEIDILTFETLVREAEGLAEEQPEQAVDRYRRALQLYDGEFLPDCRYEDWTQRTCERLRARYLYAAEALARLLLAGEHLEESLTWCYTILDIDPCWEPAYRLLMRAHVALDQRHLAGRAYERCVEALRSELDLAPMPETRQLYKSLINVTSAI